MTTRTKIHSSGGVAYLSNISNQDAESPCFEATEVPGRSSLCCVCPFINGGHHSAGPELPISIHAFADIQTVAMERLYV